MELKDFIKDTVTQIAEAVTELNGGQTKYKLTVNPISSSGISNRNSINVGYDTCHVTNIEFDLTLTASENKENNAKVGVFASAIGLGVSSNNGANNESVSKIRFSLPVVLPGNEV